MVQGPIGLPLELYKTSDAEEVKDLVTFLFKTIVYESSQYPTAPKNPRGLRHAIEVLCLNLLCAVYSHPNAYVFYSRASDYYTGKPISLNHLKSTIAGLKENGYLTEQRGVWKDEDGQSYRSRVQAQEPITDLFSEYCIQMHMLKVSRWFQAIRIKDEDKRPMALPTDRKSQRKISLMQRRLAPIQRVIDRVFIGLNVTDHELHEINEGLGASKNYLLDFSRKQLYRVFNNGDLSKGGRFYGGWWQSVPSKYRKRITIHTPDDHTPRCIQEVDFSSVQPTLAYARLGERLSGSAYDIPAVVQAPEHHREAVRDVAKRTLLTMLNVNSPRAVHGAVYKWLRKQWKKQHKTETTPRVAELLLPKDCPRVAELVRQLVQKHLPIRELFCTGIGLELMYEESRIAEEIMYRLARIGIAAFPIHDSFLVVHADSGSGPGYVRPSGLAQMMKDAFEELAGIPCDVTFDDNNLTIVSQSLDSDGNVVAERLIQNAEGDLQDPSRFEEHIDAKRTYFTLLEQWQNSLKVHPIRNMPETEWTRP